jgi:hypothetical protein
MLVAALGLAADGARARAHLRFPRKTPAAAFQTLLGLGNLWFPEIKIWR